MFRDKTRKIDIESAGDDVTLCRILHLFIVNPQRSCVAFLLEEVRGYKYLPHAAGSVMIPVSTRTWIRNLMGFSFTSQTFFSLFVVRSPARAWKNYILAGSYQEK